MNNKIMRKSSFVRALTSAALAIPAIALASPSTTTTTNKDQSVVSNEAVNPLNTNESSYDPKAIFGENSYIFTRKINPVQSVFADVMYAVTNIRHNDQSYNLIPGYPDPHVGANCLYGYFEIPISQKIDLTAKANFDAVTSATPYSYGSNPSNPQQSVTGASVKNKLYGGELSFNYYSEKITSNILFGASRENDYSSYHIGIGQDVAFNEENTILMYSSSYTRNNSFPNTSEIVTSPSKGVNIGWQFTGGATQVLTKNSLLQGVATFMYDSGFLADPYKPHKLPNLRKSWSLASRYMHYLSLPYNPGLEVDYRYYFDNWGMHSHTAEALLRYALPYGWGLIPGIRYYSQNRNDYYTLIQPPFGFEGYYTSDYRRASFGQLEGSLEVDKELSSQTTAYIGGSYGIRNASLHLGGKDVTNPQEGVFTKTRTFYAYIGLRKAF